MGVAANAVSVSADNNDSAGISPTVKKYFSYVRNAVGQTFLSANTGRNACSIIHENYVRIRSLSRQDAKAQRCFRYSQRLGARSTSERAA